jgi:AraC-like DNA-binding protein
MPSRDAFRLPSSYFRYVAEGLRGTGVDVDCWLLSCGLTEAQLASASFELDFQTFEKLIRNSLAMTSEAATGLFVGRHLGANSHGIVGFAAMCCRTVREGLELIARFARLRTTMLSISIQGTARGVRMCFEESFPLGEIRRPVLEAVVLGIESAVASVGACRARAVAFSFPEPGYAALAREMFGCEVRYGDSWTGFEIAEEALDAPLRTADGEAFREAELLCKRELEKLAQDESTASRVRRALLDGFPSLPSTARMLHLTPRTLHRRLLDEGTSFRALLDDVRHTVAVEQMRSKRFSLKEIAYQLGYSDLANFRRAFRRWQPAFPFPEKRRERS